jgi:hypothetical protein
MPLSDKTEDVGRWAGYSFPGVVNVRMMASQLGSRSPLTSSNDLGPPLADDPMLQLETLLRESSLPQISELQNMSYNQSPSLQIDIQPSLPSSSFDSRSAVSDGSFVSSMLSGSAGLTRQLEQQQQLQSQQQQQQKQQPQQQQQQLSENTPSHLSSLPSHSYRPYRMPVPLQPGERKAPGGRVMKGPTVYGAAIAAGVHPLTPVMSPTTGIELNTSSKYPVVETETSIPAPLAPSNNGYDVEENDLPVKPKDQIKGTVPKSEQQKKQNHLFRFWKVILIYKDRF